MECQQIYQNVKNAILGLFRFPEVRYWNCNDLLTCHPRVEPARIGQYHESDFGLPGELVDKGA